MQKTRSAWGEPNQHREESAGVVHQTKSCRSPKCLEVGIPDPPMSTNKTPEEVICHWKNNNGGVARLEKEDCFDGWTESKQSTGHRAQSGPAQSEERPRDGLLGMLAYSMGSLMGSAAAPALFSHYLTACSTYTGWRGPPPIISNIGFLGFQQQRRACFSPHLQQHIHSLALSLCLHSLSRQHPIRAPPRLPLQAST